MAISEYIEVSAASANLFAILQNAEGRMHFYLQTMREKEEGSRDRAIANRMYLYWRGVVSGIRESAEVLELQEDLEGLEKTKKVRALSPERRKRALT